MAVQLSASIYRIGQTDLKSGAGSPALQGITMSFPTQDIRIEAAPLNTTANNATMLTVIRLLPTGLVQGTKDFYSPTATATVIAAANA